MPSPDPRQRASFSHPSDVDAFVDALARFESGELSAEGWRQFRLLSGNYGQRQEGALMQRVKVPQGVVSAAQLEVVAEIADGQARGFVHVTTRQDFQLHFVSARGAEAALRRLAEAGVTTREACGNAVRNVTACPFAGVGVDEVFDPSPYAEALTRHFLRHPLASSLPRKFKIAFEGCPVDHAATSIHDLGFVARRLPGGGRGFLVRAGGGTATVPVSAAVLDPALAAGDLLELAEAVLRVFHRLGDRERRHANRLKFLIRALGFDGFVREVGEERARVRAEGAPRLPFDPEAPPEEGPPPGARVAPPPPAVLAARVRAERLRGPGLVPAPRPELAPGPAALAAFATTNVRPQRQPGFVAVEVVLPLGDVTAAQLRAVAELSRAHGDGMVRLTRAQGLVLRWVPEAELARLHAGLAAIGLGAGGAGTAAQVTSCPGAETCRLAVTHSRGLARLLEGHLRDRPGLVEGAPGLDLKISGCPNGCSQHHVAAIGLQGSVRRVGASAVPQYFVLVGGGLGPEGARFGRLAAKVPARRVAAALDRLLALFRAEARPGEDAAAFFARIEPEQARAAIGELAELEPAAVSPEDLVDLGEETAPPAEPGDGERAA